MEEVLPPTLISVFGGLYCFSFAIATIIAYVLALGLPLDTEKEELKTNEFWRVIFALPILFYVVQLIFMKTVIKYESPKYLLLKIKGMEDAFLNEKDQEKLAKLESDLNAMIKLIYVNTETQE